jgi:23S rRNA (cytidine1920-2'-O)/16S rRNA (cytidine1409-2'-O)-methyltransferase
MIEKERLDKLLVDRKLIESREKARRFIMANLVMVNGKKINKAGTRCNIDSELLIEEVVDRFVSRGGNKLDKALKEFDVEVKDCIVIDIGASTGGFTDCLLQHGAKKVYCVDVGYGQLDWTLRNDKRIVNMEKTNIRYLDKEQFDIQFDLATIDVSFISLEKVLPLVKELLKPDGIVIALIKPQFEAGKEKVKKGGIVNDPEIHKEVIVRLIRSIINDYQFKNITFSPVKNSPGNIEYLVHLIKNKGENPPVHLDYVKKTVTEAHQYFFKKNQ